RLSASPRSGSLLAALDSEIRDAGPDQLLEQRRWQRLRRREMEAALGPPEAFDLGGVRRQERIGQWVEAAVPLPAGVRHEESTGGPERRHVVGDRLLCVRPAPPG